MSTSWELPTACPCAMGGDVLGEEAGIELFMLFVFGPHHGVVTQMTNSRDSLDTTSRVTALSLTVS